MHGLLPKALYAREKFAFMAPPAHTDPKKWTAMRVLADEYLDKQSLQEAGCLDADGVASLFALHENENTSTEPQVQLDAVINHMLGVQILHRQFVATDMPALARKRADELCWRIASYWQ